MAENEIEIEVTLDAKGAEQGLKKIKEGGEAVGETFTGVGQNIAAFGGEANQRLGAVGESVGGVAEAMIGLKDAASGSKGSFLALLGPIGAVTAGVFALVDAIKDYTGASKEAEIRTDAYKASTAELTTIVEELASQEVKLTDLQVKRLGELAMAAKIPLEEAQGLRESNATRAEQIFLLDERIKRDRQVIKTFGKNVYTEFQLNDHIARRAKLRAKLESVESRAFAKSLEASEKLVILEREKLRLEKEGAKFKREAFARETALIGDAQIKILQSQEQTLLTQTRLATTETRKRLLEIELMEDTSGKVKSKLILAEQKALQFKLKGLRDADAKKRQAEEDKETAKRKMRAARRLARERINQAELARIRRAEIEKMKITGADALDVLKHQETLALKLAGDNANARIAIQMEFENRRLSIQQEAEEKRIDAAKEAAEKERELEDKRRAFILESVEFDLNAQQDGIDKELALLDLRYQREMELRGRSEEEITELTRRHTIQRNRMLEENAKQGYTALNSTLDGMGQSLQQGFGRSIFDSFTRVRMESKEAMAGLSDDFEKEKKRIQESGEGVAYINQQMTELQANYARERANIRKSEEGAGSRMVGELLMALGQQAAVEALMFSAKGTAALFTNPAAAGGYFTASAIMGVAAVTAGASGSSLLSGGGGGGGGSIAPDSTPTDSPTTAPSPERAQADSSAMVFNINFGNSTIYDTKRAAQDAMADNIIRTINRQRRGAPRFAMG